jgi:hypothetical protein
MRGIKRALLTTCAIGALALSAAACNDDGDDAESNDNASQESIDALALRVERNEQLFALTAMGQLGLHDMDEGLNDTGTIESSYTPNTRRAVRLLALTDWGQFQDDAEDLRAHAETLLTALQDEDIEAAKDAAHELHEGEHEFSRAVMNELVKDLDPDLGGPEIEEESSETPADGHGTEESPEAEATP